MGRSPRARERTLIRPTPLGRLNAHYGRAVDPVRAVRPARRTGEGSRGRGRRPAPHRRDGRALRAEPHDGARRRRVDSAPDEGPLRCASDGHPPSAFRDGLRGGGGRPPHGPRGERPRRPDDDPRDPGRGREARPGPEPRDGVRPRGPLPPGRGLAPRDDGATGLRGPGIPLRRRPEDPRGAHVPGQGGPGRRTPGRWRHQDRYRPDRGRGGGGHPRVRIRDLSGPCRREPEETARGRREGGPPPLVNMFTALSEPPAHARGIEYFHPSLLERLSYSLYI